MKEDLKMLWRMPWKHKILMALFLVVSIAICYLRVDLSLMLIKSILFSVTLMVASYFDICTRQIPNWVHIFNLLIGLIQFSLIQSILGMLLPVFPLIVMALIQQGSFGGGDIKIISSIEWCVGLTSNIFIIVIALIVLITVTFCKKLTLKSSEQFAPFLFIVWY